MTRDYTSVRERAAAIDGDREARMEAFVDVLWEILAPTGVSWAGFYLDAGDGENLVLGPRRDKPACSPIGLHGACGVCFTTREPLIVRDVAELGGAYIACDPRDRSEVVVPCIDESGACWGVLDLDSWDVGSFSRADAEELRAALHAAGLTTR
ncbi:MAG: GAF domain-containing protein [Phycisphaerales bacterium]|nr:MAG: GAF domain-containing protein [Phycisphaerales bacterium]